MKRVMIAGVALFVASNVNADSVDSAYQLCGALNKVEYVTQCDVSGWGSSVDTTIDTSGAEARKICANVADMMRDKFSGGWKLQIFSPYSGDRPIAVCKLG